MIALATKDPEDRFETMADGRLVVSALTDTLASFAESELVWQVVIWNKVARLGRVVSSSGGTTLADGAIKGSDAAFISNGRVAAISSERKKRTFEQVAPDADFERLSASDRLVYTTGKCREYVVTPVVVLRSLSIRATVASRFTVRIVHRPLFATQPP